MPTYEITHPVTGDTIEMTGTRPPDKSAIDAAFEKVGIKPSGPAPKTMGYTPEQLQAAQQAGIDSQQAKTPMEKFKVNAADFARSASPYLRPIVEGGMSAVGGTMGATGGAAAGLGVGSVPAAVAGGVAGTALGFGIGKNLMDTYDESLGMRDGGSILNRGLQTVADLEQGTTIGLSGPVIDKVVVGGVSTLRAPVSNARKWLQSKLESSAVDALAGARTSGGAVAGQVALNKAETYALQQRIPGWKAAAGQASDDPATLALQRRLQMQSDEAKILAADQTMGNNAALSTHLDNSLPSGSVDDVLGAIGKAKAGVSTAREQASNGVITTANAIEGQAKQEAGQALRDGAGSVKAKLQQKAGELYSKVDRNLELDSSPLMQAIDDVGGMQDPAFANIKNIPTSVMGRAGSALEQQPMTILGADGLPYNAPQIAAGQPKNINFGQLQDFRSQVGTLEREAKSASNFQLADKYRRLREGAEDVLKLAESSGNGESVQALRDANKFYRETYVPTIRQGGTSKILATDKTGGTRVENALVGGQYFKAGDKGVEAAASFTRTFGKDPAAREAIKDYAAQDLLQYAKNPVTGEVEAHRVSAWMSRNKNALDNLNLGADFGDIAAATKAAESARKIETAFNKTKFANVLEHADPDKAMSQLFSGANSKDTVRTMQSLLDITKGDKAATDGLKRSFADMLVVKSQVANTDIAGNTLTSAVQSKKLLSQFEPAMKLLYSPKELQALQDIQKAVEISGRINRNVSGVAGSQTGDLGTDLLKMVPVGPKLSILKTVFGKMKSGYENAMGPYLIKAMYDPTYAKQLVDTVAMAKMKGPTVAATKLQRYLDLSTTTRAFVADKMAQGEAQ